MTAVEIIKEIKAMTPEERGQVSKFLRQFEAELKPRSADDDSVEEVSDRILARHAELMRKLAL
jgi:hypothetical protein